MKEESNWFKWKIRQKFEVSNWMRNFGYDDFDSINMEELQETLEQYCWDLCTEIEKKGIPNAKTPISIVEGFIKYRDEAREQGVWDSEEVLMLEYIKSLESKEKL